MPATSRRRLFHSIASSPGGTAGRLLAPPALERAHARMQALAPQARAEIQKAIAVIAAEAEVEQSIDAVLSLAHDIHSLAAGFGSAGPGVVAGEIRSYILNRPPSLQPDWSLLRLLAALLSRAFDSPDEAPVDVVSDQARALVSWALARAPIA